MSYDDGKLEDRRLVSIFNKYGIKGTFHLNSGLEMDTRIPTSEYQELYKGHEVSCHTLTHPTIGPLFGSFKQQNDFFFIVRVKYLK